MQHILVPVDLSEISETVVRQGICLAQSGLSKIHLLHVLPPTNYSPNNIDRKLLRAEIAKELRAERRELSALADTIRRERIPVFPYHARGIASNTIISESRRIHASYIVMGTHQHGSVYRMLLGGTGSRVQHAASCPVILVPPEHRQDTSFLPQLDSRERSEAETGRQQN